MSRETVGDEVRSGDLTVEGSVVVESDSTDTALRITQTGSGEALRVEDSANPDSTPFVVDASGKVGIGTSSPNSTLHLSTPNPALNFTDTDTGVTSAISASSGAANLSVSINSSSQALSTNLYLYLKSVERMRVSEDGLITGSGTSLGAWTAYTPTLGGTGWALGNGTVAGAYCRVGKTIKFRARVVFGPTSTFGAAAAPTLTLPVAARDTTSLLEQSASFGVQMEDASLGARYVGFAWRHTTTEIAIARKFNTDDQVAQINSIVPFAWATSDGIHISGTYEAA